MGIVLSSNGTDVATAAPLPVKTPTALLTGFVSPSIERDAGTITTVRDVREMDASEDYRTRVGTDCLLYQEWFPGTVLNSSKWAVTAVTQTVTVTGGYVVLNAGLSVATTTSAYLVSKATFPVNGTFPLWVEFDIAFSQLPQTNNVCMVGLASVPGLTAAITDAVVMRLNASGVAELAVIGTSAGVDLTSAAIPNWSTLFPINTTRHCALMISEDNVELWVDDVKQVSIAKPVATGAMLASGQAAFYALCQNTGATTSAQTIKLAFVNVTQADENQSMTTGVRAAIMGDMCYQAPTGFAIANTVQWANNANPTAAVPTNTSAALTTGLGGQFWETYSLALTTDGIISSYQVPVSVATATNRKLVVTGVRIHSAVQTVIVGGGLIEQWGLAFGHTNVSLAQAETQPNKAPRRKILGMRTTAAAAAALTQFSNIEASFENAPIVVNPGEFVQVFKKNIGGTVGTSGVVAHAIDISGYWL